MKVSNISSPERPFFSATPNPKAFSLPSDYESKILGIRASSKTTNIFSWVWEKATQFFSWIMSWFYETEASKETDPYFKVETDGKIHYRNNENETEVYLGPRITRLEEISIPEKDEIDSLPEMIAHMMTKESIDAISTTNFYYAWLLWKAELSTKSHLTFSPQSKAPFNQFVLDVLREAFQKRDENDLSDDFQHALNKIIKGFVLEILNSTLTKETKDDGEIIGYSFEVVKAKDQLRVLRSVLNDSIDLEALVSEFPEDSSERDAIHKLKKTSTSTNLDDITADPLSFSLNAFFHLLKEIKREVQRKDACSLSQILFSKG